MTEKDIIIIGAGTAGLSAAIYAQRAGKTTLVLEREAYGGQIINTPDVENYPGIAHISGFDFATGLYEQAQNLGAEVEFADVAGVEDQGGKKIVHTTGGDFACRALILATGVQRRKLGLPKEQAFTGKGVSYCATCDGAFFKGKDVAVNGGGNTALEDAQYLSRIAGKVYLIHRRDAFRADPAEVKKIEGKENVIPVLNCTVTDLVGDGKLSGVEVMNKVTGEKKVLPVSALFVAIGQAPSNAAFAGLVDLDEAGYIRAGEDCKTSRPGVFAAGDCRTKSVRQLTTAAADGAVAALAAAAYLG
ncbi:MAG: thioredoxin-disulfide reductase [Lachnospiraceae bacterium]|jgi:thioredoxin reductase (NADPH)|nr:thioredoxin-disulfide reductase [Lachnospiraceae bacterium]